MNIQAPDIEIVDPIRLNLVVAELESDRIPSFRADVEALIEHPTGVFKYTASDIWITTERWDLFIRGLRDLERGVGKEASLDDMSRAFSLSLASSYREGFTFRFAAEEPETGRGSGSISFAVEIDRDVLASLCRNFEKFPRWW